MREYIEEEFFRKGILVVPDFVANAGGVISSYAEYRGYSHEKMFKLVEKKIKKCDNRRAEAKPQRKPKPREVAMEIAVKNVENKMK